jgi:hypothetical protein
VNNPASDGLVNPSTVSLTLPPSVRPVILTPLKTVVRHSVSPAGRPGSVRVSKFPSTSLRPLCHRCSGKIPGTFPLARSIFLLLLPFNPILHALRVMADSSRPSGAFTRSHSGGRLINSGATQSASGVRNQPPEPTHLERMEASISSLSAQFSALMV